MRRILAILGSAIFLVVAREPLRVTSLGGFAGGMLNHRLPELFRFGFSGCC